MPELPEVENIARDLQQLLAGQTVQVVSIMHSPTIIGMAVQFGSRLVQSRVESVKRRGKYIVIRLSDVLGNPFFWVTHLRMSGAFLTMAPDEPMHPHTRIVVQFKSFRLAFRDQRKFARMFVADNLGQLSNIGPDPLEVTAADFMTRLQNKHRAIKAVLLDQHLISGIGNIYADESLWQAKIHPAASAATLSADQLSQLHAKLQETLQTAIAAGGSTLDQLYRRVNGKSGRYQEQFAVYGRAKKPCQRCGSTLAKTVIAQRTTVFCPQCQRL